MTTYNYITPQELKEKAQAYLREKEENVYRQELAAASAPLNAAEQTKLSTLQADLDNARTKLDAYVK